MRLDELDRLKEYSDEDDLLKISEEIGDKIRFRGYNQEQVLDVLCDAATYYDIRNIVNWDSIMSMRGKL